VSLVYKVHKACPKRVYKVNALIIKKLCYLLEIYYNIDNQLFMFDRLKCLYFLDRTHLLNDFF